MLEERRVLDEFRDFGRVPSAFLPVLKKFLELVDEHGQYNLIAAVLFGSVARNSWTDGSDLDLFLIFDDIPGKGTEARLEITHELAKVKYKMYQSVEFREFQKRHYPVQFQLVVEVISGLQVFSTLHYDIAADGVILLDRGQVAREFLSSTKQQIQEKNIERVQAPNGGLYWKHPGVVFGEVREV
ncbi:MAG: nucleotidyltransferase domain-containing protein [Promethearchaeota archaeon]